ncbi:hypothetical protein MMC14_004156 [Varicellaria rhodocarpa]|nr:hypothetical protein [Varicellaria rhodocarpa]
MGFFTAKNQFPVDGRTIIITGGSQGMGLSVARLLASKGANILIVARNPNTLQEALQKIQASALRPSTQRFTTIAADLSTPSEASRVIAETTSWNDDSPPDIVWCCAGSAHPTLFHNTPIEKLQEQMSSNYFTAAYTAHAVLNAWIQQHSPSNTTTAPSQKPTTGDSSPPPPPPQPKHLIFTSSTITFYPILGYSAYSPAKSALRTLSDTLSQELLLHPTIKIHTVFPGTIFTDAYHHENAIKHPLTKKLEEDDPGQTPEEVAAVSVRALERGDELVTTNWLGWAMYVGALGGSRRTGWGVLDTVGAWVVTVVLAVVRWHQDGQVRRWAREKRV